MINRLAIHTELTAASLKPSMSTRKDSLPNILVATPGIMHGFALKGDTYFNALSHDRRA